MRLIDADALIKRIDFCVGQGLGETLAHTFRRMVMESPTIDPSGDLISRADAMGAIQDHFNADGFKGYDDGQKMMNRIKGLKSVTIDYAPTPFTIKTTSVNLQQTCNKLATDLISRAEAKKQISEWATILTKPTMLDKDATMVVLDELPSVSVEDSIKEEVLHRLLKQGYIEIPSVSAERVGEWSAEIGYEGEVLYYECSNCKEAFSLLEGTPEENKYNYCPNCGAKMKGGAE